MCGAMIARTGLPFALLATAPGPVGAVKNASMARRSSAGSPA
jgi:hypothetical protein